MKTKNNNPNSNLYLLAGYIVFYMIFHHLIPKGGILQGSSLLYFQCTSYIVLGIIGLYLSGKEFVKGFICWQKHFSRNLLWLTGAFAAEMLLSNIAAIPSYLLHSENLGGNTEGIEAAFRLLPLPLIILALGVMGPIVEEVVFRITLIYFPIEKIKKHSEQQMRWVVIVCLTISSLGFMLIHVRTMDLIGITDTLPQFATGIIFAITYYKTKNITIPVIIHILNNSLSLFVSGISL